MMTTSCTKKNTQTGQNTEVEVETPKTYEKFVDERLTITLPHTGLDVPPVVVSMQISYTGKEGAEDVFKKNENLILDLIRTKAAGFSLKELKKGDGLSKFERELLETINSFVAKNTFVKIQVLKIKEV